MKPCRTCEEPLPLSRYRRNAKSADGHESVCKRCRSISDRIQKLRKRYGISPEGFRALSASQGGLCAVCRSEPKEGHRLQVDHCHDTGAIRGLLCGRCNRALGLLKDAPYAIARAAVYVALNKQEDT